MQEEAKSIKVNGTLIPIIIVILVILGGLYIVLGKDLKLPSFDKKPQITRIENFPTVVYTTKVLEKQRRVITSKEELSDFLNYVDDTGLLGIKEEINFEKLVLIGVSTPTEDRTGNTIKIKKAYENTEENKILILIENKTPGETCEVDLDTNVAVDLVSISKTDMAIDFDKVEKVVECN